MKTIPIFGQSIKSISSEVSSQRRLNCFYQLTPDGDKSQIAVRPTPGLTLFTTLPTSPIRGMYSYGNFLYVVAGTSLYQVASNGTWVQLASFTNYGDVNTLNPVEIAINETQIMIVDGVHGYVLPFNQINTSGSQQMTSILQSIQLLSDIVYRAGL